MKNAPMSGRTASLLAAFSAIALLVLVLLYAFVPELSAGSSNDANALSRSAVGFAGLKQLLDATHIPAEIDRGPQSRSSQMPSLTILTPNARVTGRQLATFRTSGPILVILPKWQTAALPTNTDWVQKFGAIPTSLLQGQIVDVLGTVTVLRAKDNVSLSAMATNSAAPSGVGAIPFDGIKIESLQTLLGGIPLLRTDQGVLLTKSRRRGFPLYVLSEPDLMNNHGLANPQSAKATLALITSLRQGDGPVRMDVTLDGLALAPSVLRSLFEPPFLGATLCALLAALLMGLHAARRFGAPLHPTLIFARGKKALADNSADLVRMMGREGAMAPRYVAAARNLVLERLGARRGTPQAEDALLATLARGSGADITYNELAGEAAAASGGSDLLRIARKTYEWRRRISGGHR